MNAIAHDETRQHQRDPVQRLEVAVGRLEAMLDERQKTCHRHQESIADLYKRQDAAKTWLITTLLSALGATVLALFSIFRSKAGLLLAACLLLAGCILTDRYVDPVTGKKVPSPLEQGGGAALDRLLGGDWKGAILGGIATLAMATVAAKKARDAAKQRQVAEVATDEATHQRLNAAESETLRLAAEDIAEHHRAATQEAVQLAEILKTQASIAGAAPGPLRLAIQASAARQDSAGIRDLIQDARDALDPALKIDLVPTIPGTAADPAAVYHAPEPA
jgi:hypothetical protein